MSASDTGNFRLLRTETVKGYLEGPSLPKDEVKTKTGKGERKGFLLWKIPETRGKKNTSFQ